jgi:hypothetical protein
MQVLAFGVGRTGTLSLKLALERLGFGPCHHMEDVASPANIARQVPLWTAAVDGRPDWPAIYDGFNSADDWPTAGFFRELIAAYPQARYILTTRDPEAWADSFSATIALLVANPDALPPPMQDWGRMAIRVLARTGFPQGLDRAGLLRAFQAHTEAVRAAAPPDRLLVYEVRQGWGPLCAFLGVPVPEEPFPRRNNRQEFWEQIHTAAPPPEPAPAA